jgi:hypothetical protein
MNPRPVSATKALENMIRMCGMPYPYILGTGDHHADGLHGPWDCAGAAMCAALEVKRHRPGFARGPLPHGWERFADVTDDINTNSGIKDAIANRDLFTLVPDGEPLLPADLLAYPTIRIRDADDGEVHTFIGHVQMVKHPRGALAGGPYSGVIVLHAHGPNSRVPAVTEDFAIAMDKHNERWPKPFHKAHALRIVP